MHISRKTDMILNAVDGPEIVKAERFGRDCPYRDIQGKCEWAKGEEKEVLCSHKGSYDCCEIFRYKNQEHLAQVINNQPELFFLKEIADKIEKLTFAVNDLRLEIKDKK